MDRSSGGGLRQEALLRMLTTRADVGRSVLLPVGGADGAAGGGVVFSYGDGDGRLFAITWHYKIPGKL